jgi:hypothetical protein
MRRISAARQLVDEMAGQGSAGRRRETTALFLADRRRRGLEIEGLAC